VTLLLPGGVVSLFSRLLGLREWMLRSSHGRAAPPGLVAPPTVQGVPVTEENQP
jgi:hypothetical protein